MNLYNTIDKNVFLPLADLIMGTKIIKYYNFLIKSQWWSLEELRRYQNKKLRLLIKHAYSNVPYYHKKWKSLNIYPDDIKSTKDLEKIPIVTKSDIRDNFEDFKTKDFNIRKPKIHSTGGSTGEPLKYWLDWNTYSLSWATTIRGWSWGDYNWGDKVVSLRGSLITPEEKEGFKKMFKDKIIFRIKNLSAFDMSPKSIRIYLKEIINYRPKFFFGYPSALANFARNIPDGYNGFSKLKAVFTNAEVLFKHDRKIIEESLGVEVFDGYGARDGGISAMECEKHNGHHLSMESSVGEFIKDNEEVSPGETGNIIVTSLTNYSFPFIRYEIGDSGIKSDETCPCGRELPLIKSLKGRINDGIRTPDNTFIDGFFFSKMFSSAYGIKQYQIIQDNINSLSINIIPDKNFKNDEIDKIEKTVRYRIGNNMKLQIKLVKNIPLTAAGKRKLIISKL